MAVVVPAAVDILGVLLPKQALLAEIMEKVVKDYIQRYLVKAVLVLPVVVLLEVDMM